MALDEGCHFAQAKAMSEETMPQDQDAVQKASAYPALEREILRMTAERGPDKTICPSEPARIIAGSAGDAWGALMPHVRRVAVQLASEGKIVITRKGKPVDPHDFKGVYRLGQPRSE
jgi:Protein of unknown function (DUF3253)